MESSNERCNSSSEWIRRSENRAFFIKRHEKKEGKSKLHHDYIQDILKKWSDLQISNKHDKNPYFKNLYFDIFYIIKEIDYYSETSSHISSGKNIDYEKCNNSYKKLEQLQNNNNELIEIYIKKLEDKISVITNNNNIDTNNLISYIIGQFLNKNLHNSQIIDSEIERIKENHPDVIIYTYEDIENPKPELSYKLSPNERDTFDNLIDAEKDSLIEQLRAFETRKNEIEQEFNNFKRICAKIVHDMDTSDLKGRCEKEADFKFIPKLKKKFKCYKLND